jgi:mono/diheme cytochrome c family protein
MRTRRYLGATVVLACLIGLGAGPRAAERKSDPAQFARGAKAWVQQCGRCHALRNVKDQTDGEWSVSVSHMRVRGNIPGQVARDIEAFLKASN